MKPKDFDKLVLEVEAALEKKHGAGIIQTLGGKAIKQVEVISTGSLSVDKILGVGGLPRGRIVEVYGPESSGKTTLTLHAIAEAQKAGGHCAFVDAEHALDLAYANALGVNTKVLRVCQPDCGEQALDVVETLAASSLFSLIVVDSVAALTPRSEIEGDFGDAQMGSHARLMSQAMRKLTGTVAKSNTTVIFINQIRMKIGVTWGSPETTTGGNALKFYASVRIDIRRIGALKRGDTILGNKTRIKVVKNKLAPPFRECEVDIRYGIGIDRVSELLDLALDAGVVLRKGSWFSFADEQIGQGREGILTLLRSNTELLDNIKKAYATATAGTEDGQKDGIVLD